MKNPAWKKAERRAAKALGGKRVALSGGPGARTKGDVELPGWTVEVKYRKLWHVFSLFLEVEKVARKEGKNALLILTERNTHGQLAVVRIEDFAKLPAAKKGGKKHNSKRSNTVSKTRRKGAAPGRPRHPGRRNTHGDRGHGAHT